MYVGDGPIPPNFIQVCPRRSISASDGLEAGDTQSLSYFAEHTDPLVYPLLHVDGCLGWSCNLESDVSHIAAAVKRTRINMTEFYAYRLMTRVGTDDDIVELPHSAGKLFQQHPAVVISLVCLSCA